MMSHYRLPRRIAQREPFVLEMCKAKRVLHLGCADFPYTEEQISNGNWLHSKVTEVSSECLGVDLSEDAVETLRRKHDVHNVIVGNVEALDELALDRFDVVLAGEIIEHLNNPGRFLESARSVLKSNGRLVITTANAFAVRRLLRIPFGIESVHPDHVYYFSHSVLHTLATRFDYVLEQAYGYALPRSAPRSHYLLERMISWISPNLCEGLIHVYRAPTG